MYGWCGREKIASVVPLSATRPAYMTTTSSAVSATTPRSCVMITIALPKSS